MYHAGVEEEFHNHHGPWRNNGTTKEESRDKTILPKKAGYVMVLSESPLNRLGNSYTSYSDGDYSHNLQVLVFGAVAAATTDLTASFTISIRRCAIRRAVTFSV